MTTVTTRNDSITTADPDTLWTVKEVAHYLRVSTSLVYKKAEAGTMPCVRIFGSLRFDPAAIKTWALGGKSAGNVVSMPARKA